MKRKLLLTLTAFVCALCCAFGLAACGADDTEASAPVTEVTAAEWTQILEGADNFTVTGTEGDDIMTGKVDGVSVMQDMGTQKQVLTKDGENYYGYSFDGTNWTRTTLNADGYNRRVTLAKMPAFFKDDFSSFTYADGKYTVASLDKTSSLGGTFTNVEISFKDGNLAEMKFVMQNGFENISYEIKNVGTTTVTLPTSFTESNG